MSCISLYTVHPLLLYTHSHKHLQLFPTLLLLLLYPQSYLYYYSVLYRAAVTPTPLSCSLILARHWHQRGRCRGHISISAAHLGSVSCRKSDPCPYFCFCNSRLGFDDSWSLCPAVTSPPPAQLLFCWPTSHSRRVCHRHAISTPT